MGEQTRATPHQEEQERMVGVLGQRGKIDLCITNRVSTIRVLRPSTNRIKY